MKEIADVMGCTRNTIIGKCRRMGLRLKPHKNGTTPKPTGPSTKERNTVEKILKQKVEKIAMTRMMNQPVVPEPLPAERQGEYTLLELGHNDCRWPSGDKDFTFCGMPIQPGFPYCAHHTKKAYQKYGHR